MPAMVRAAFSAAFLWGWLLEVLASRSTRYISSAASSSLEAISQRRLSSGPFSAREQMYSCSLSFTGFQRAVLRG